MSDCKVPGCDWTNIYMTCQDGSREYAAYQHSQTHEAAAHSAENDAPEDFDGDDYTRLLRGLLNGGHAAENVPPAGLVALLAAHRQQHDPQTGASTCLCGEWVGPFTVTEDERSFASHLARLLSPLFAQTWAAGFEAGGGRVLPPADSWARKHARENPGHRTREGLDDPGSCDDCRDRSPAYDLADARVLPPGREGS